MGVTYVDVNALDRRLIVRYDTSLTSEATVIAGIDTIISNIGR